ncbi:hypothetical protein JNUCC0626_50135 (plasmid) [Lentzea sp. JNUCC 0626]|uniref:hypothetical protein n=1 Tax=Lentzea sp. JNUCC 0626 TaxID=3367513 RepID=UPI00374A55FC
MAPIDAQPAAPTPVSPETHGKPAAPATQSAKSKMRITVDIDLEVGEDAKDAYWAAQRLGQVDKWAHFIEDALASRTSQLRDELNDGKPFPHRPQRGRGENFAGGRPLS